MFAAPAGLGIGFDCVGILGFTWNFVLIRALITPMIEPVFACARFQAVQSGATSGHASCCNQHEQVPISAIYDKWHVV